MGENTIECPKCGHENDPSAVECDKCGVTFSIIFRKTKTEKIKLAASKAKSGKNISADLKVCPKCGHKVIPPAEECINCGIIFQKYFEFQERKQKEEKERAEAEKKALEQREKEEKEKAEAEKKALEQAEKEEKEEKEKAEAEKNALKQTKEQESIGSLKQEIEMLKNEAESLKKDKTEKEKAEKARIDKEEKEKAQARQKEAQDQKKIEELTEAAEALKSRAELLQKEKESLERAEAERNAEAEKQAQEEKARAEAIQKERADQKQRMESILKTLVPQPNFVALLTKYEGEEIGINFDDPAEIKSARLAKVNEDHFSIMNMENELLYSYPYNNIVSIVEAVDGVPVDASGQKATYPMVVRVLHLMVKKKWSFI